LKKWPFLKKWKFSQKKFLWLIIGAAICILIYAFWALPFIEASKKTQEEIILKKRVMLKYKDYLQNRKAVEEELDSTLKQREGVQKRLLPGETAQVGAANLQEIIKGLSEKDGIGIRSFVIREPKEIDLYSKVSIQIEFNPVNSLLSFGQFIYDIEHHEKELMISEMDILVFNLRMPNSFQGSMAISGLMKGTKTKEKRREG
jgi:Tfp pilus assembly protein PilO